MKKILFVVALFVSAMLYAQAHPVEIVGTKDAQGFIFTATNHSSTQQEVVLTIQVENLRGYKKPVTKLIPANTSLEMIRLDFIKGKRSTYRSNYTYVAKPTKEEQEIKIAKLKAKAISNIGDLTKGIVVFSKDGCTRCHYVTSYMLDNDIDFKFLNTTKNEEYRKIMWMLIRDENPNFSDKSVNMPVVLVDGKMSYNMKLNEFVKGLKN